MSRRPRHRSRDPRMPREGPKGVPHRGLERARALIIPPLRVADLYRAPVENMPRRAPARRGRAADARCAAPRPAGPTASDKSHPGAHDTSNRTDGATRARNASRAPAPCACSVVALPSRARSRPANRFRTVRDASAGAPLVCHGFVFLARTRNGERAERHLLDVDLAPVRIATSTTAWPRRSSQAHGANLDLGWVLRLRPMSPLQTSR